MIEFNQAFQVPTETIGALKKKFCDSCPNCKGTRRITTITETIRSVKPCACVAEFMSAFNLAKANIPESLAPLTVDDLNTEFKQTNSAFLERVLKYIMGMPDALKDGFGLYIYGDNGSGKSFISTLILKQAIKKGYSAYFIMLKDLLDVAFESLSNSVVRQDLSTLIAQVDFLVIDDIDSVSSDNQAVQALLTSLFKKRAYSGKPLIVTATTSRTQIKDTLGKTIYSVFEEKLSEIIFIGDFRGQIRASLEDKYFGNGD